MRIESVEAVALSIPLTKDFGGSTYHVLKRCTVVTRVRTADGVTGEVYNGDNREHGPEIVRLIHELLAPLVKGEDLFSLERVWDKMFAQSHAYGDKKLLLEAIACVDCALWDAYGKALGRSVRQLLGGYRTKLPLISIGGYYVEGKTHLDIGKEMELYKKAGMAGCKFKVGGLSPEEDAKRVAAARDAAGKDFILIVDANRGWSAPNATRFARLIEPLNITWFEEPCHWYDDVALMAQVRRATRIPVTAGQCEYTSHGVRRLVDGNAVDFINYDASEGGGVTDWRRAAALCQTAGVRMAHHEESQISRHLLAGVMHGTYAECFADPARDPVWQTMWLNRPPAKNGMIDVADDPGFGLELDQEFIKRYRVA